MYTSYDKPGNHRRLRRRQQTVELPAIPRPPPMVACKVVTVRTRHKDTRIVRCNVYGMLTLTEAAAYSINHNLFVGVMLQEMNFVNTVFPVTDDGILTMQSLKTTINYSQYIVEL